MIRSKASTSLKLSTIKGAAEKAMVGERIDISMRAIKQRRAAAAVRVGLGRKMVPGIPEQYLRPPGGVF